MGSDALQDIVNFQAVDKTSSMAWPDSFCCGNGLYMDRDVAGSPDIWARLEGNMENMLVIEESIGYLPMVLEADSLAEGKP